MEPTIGMGGFLPFWAWTGVTGALAASTIFVYLPEIKRAGRWVVSHRRRRSRQIAEELDKIQTKREAERIVRAFRPTEGEKGDQ